MRSNRWLAGVFLLLMGAMAAGALALALGTLQSRKTRDPKIPPIATGPRAFAPAELPALGYLPEGCNLVAGIHVTDLLNTPTGKRLLDPPRFEWVDKGLATIESWTGLQAGAFDHVAIGTKVSGDVPQLVVALRTRQPYRLEELAKRFPGKAFPHHKRPLFRLKFQPIGGGYLWCADERTLVLLLRPDAVKIEDMDQVPAFPRPPAEALSKALRLIVEEHVRHAEAWLAGDLERAEPLADLLKLFPVLGKQAPPLARVRSFAVGVRDAASLQPWRDYLQAAPFPGIASRRVISTAEQNQIDFQFRIPAAATAIAPKQS